MKSIDSWTRRMLYGGMACSLITAISCGGADAAIGSREVLPDGSVLISYLDVSNVQSDTLAFDLAIGRAEGEPWETFGQVSALEVAQDGSIFVLDFQRRAVQMFDSEGTYRRSIGREGDGPGEFRRPTGLKLAENGTLLVRDDAGRQILVLRADGSEVARFAMPANGNSSPAWDAAIDEDGVLWQGWRHTESSAAPQTMTLTGLTEAMRRYYARSYDFSTGSSDSIQIAELPVRFIRWPQGRGYASAGVPFDPQVLIAIQPDRSTWTAITDTYHVTHMSRSGSRTAVQVNVQGPLVASEQRAGWQDLVERSEAGIEVPERHHALTRLFTDDKDQLWVQRRVAEGEAAHLDVFDARGALLGSVRVIGNLAMSPAPVIRGGYFYGVVLGSLDVAQVVRAPLPPFAR